MVDEATALNFISDKNKSIHLLINLTYNYFPEDTDAIKQAFNMWFLRKGVLLDAHTRFHDVIFSDETEEVKKLLERLKYIIKTLTRLYYLKKDDDYEKTKRQIEYLEEEKNAIRLELINKSKAFSALETMWDADIDDILKLIPPESSLIDFALIPQYDFDTNKWKDEHYYVFIISHDSVELLDLGDASTINNLIDQLRQNIFPVGERGNVSHEKQDKRDRKPHPSLFLGCIHICRGCHFLGAGHTLVIFNVDILNSKKTDNTTVR